MSLNDLRCPECGHYRDTPNHEHGCGYKSIKATPSQLASSTDNYQIPRIDPEKNYEDYREDLETNGELDLEKVKNIVAEYEWLRVNYQGILLSDLQYQFSKVGTHASWVIRAIQEQAYVDKMQEVQELIEIAEGGGYAGETMAETIRDFFEYDEWAKDQQR